MLASRPGEGSSRDALESRPAWATARQGRNEPAVFALTVNGSLAEVTCRPETPLLYVLRNDLNLKGTRFGCGLGQCGACMVLVDGRPQNSCTLPVWSAVGHEVVTVEGLGARTTASDLQRRFVHGQVAQCGFCMSGILITATALLQENPTPTRDEVCGALDRNLCRCGSHGRVIRAILDTAGPS